MSEYEEAIKYLQDAWDELTKQVLIPIKEYNGLHTELARRDEIIARLKDAGEHMYFTTSEDEPDDRQRVYDTWLALMKELE